MAAAVAATQKSEYRPFHLVHRAGCPCTLTTSYQVSTLPAGERLRLVHEYTTMRLVHQSKTGVVKNSLDLGPVHHELEIDSLVLTASGASNILLAKLSFDCEIADAEGKKKRDYLVFDLKIPRIDSDEEAVFCYDILAKAHGSKANLYAALKHFYDLGRRLVNPQGDKHGSKPAYSPQLPKQDQLIRHTEQMLIAYLVLPQASAMLRNRLRAEIRGKYPGAASVKVYNMGLHMHSTKTCCAPCEYSLVGLMNERAGFVQQNKPLGFLSNFQRACAVPNEQLAFTFPQNTSFQLLVTVTASNPDKDHKKQPSYLSVQLNPTDALPSHTILVKEASVTRHIFSTMVSRKYDARRLPVESNLGDKTVCISGSKQTPGSPGTMNTVKKAREDEHDLIEKKLEMIKV